MSRIDNATLQLSVDVNDSAKLRVYAVNYNVLRIMAGMGGLALRLILIILEQSIRVSFEKKLASEVYNTLQHFQIVGELLRA